MANEIHKPNLKETEMVEKEVSQRPTREIIQQKAQEYFEMRQNNPEQYKSLGDEVSEYRYTYDILDPEDEAQMNLKYPGWEKDDFERLLEGMKLLEIKQDEPNLKRPTDEEIENAAQFHFDKLKNSGPGGDGQWAYTSAKRELSAFRTGWNKIMQYEYYPGWKAEDFDRLIKRLDELEKETK